MPLPREKVRPWRRKAGFTLIEVSVVILILAMLSALVAPRLTAMAAGDAERRFRLEAQALVAQARRDAMASGQAVTLSFEASENALVLTRPSGNNDQAETRRVSLPEDVRAEAFRVRNADSNDGDWQVRCYPDGSVDAGGMQLRFGESSMALVIDPNGLVVWLNGELPAVEESRWPAGELEQRI